jgi:MFS family permease
VLILSFVFWLLVCVGLICFHNRAAIVVAFILYGLHLGAIEPVQKALVSELALPELRASSLGGYQMVIGLCALPSSLIAGILWDKVSIVAPFYLSAGLTLVAILLLLFVKENRNITQSS